MDEWTTLFPESGGPQACVADADVARPRRASQIRIDPEKARNGLLQLVLTLVELIRELLERQALRRIESGSLTPEEIERLGLTLLRLAEEVEKLKQEYGFRDEDLNFDLGPLGRLR